jgi:hypothetical protein
MIIWLASYPRSGNTFFRILLHRLYSLETHSVYPVADDEQQSVDDTHNLMALVGQPEVAWDLRAATAGSNPFFVKTHGLPAQDEAPAIVLVRDGRDAVVSYAHFLLKTTRGVDEYKDKDLFESTLEQVINGDSSKAFGGWSRHVSAWLSRTGHNLVIRYEDLIQDPVSTVQTAMERLNIGRTPHQAAVPSFEALHATVPWFFRRGRIGTWKQELPPRLQDLFLQLHGDMITELGYEAFPSKPPVGVRSDAASGNGDYHLARLTKLSST